MVERAEDQPALAHFLGVGAQKAGTTWLHDQLRLHPEIALPRRKELHYFDSAHPTRSGHRFGSRFVRTTRQALEQQRPEKAQQALDLLQMIFAPPRVYREFLAHERTEQTSVAGEICPAYATVTVEGFRAMRELLDPRIIFVLRDPLERYWSQVRHHHKGDRAEGLEERLAQTFATLIDNAAAWDRCDYPTTMALLDEVFDPQRVLLLFYEELFSEDTLSRVARFLDVAPTWSWDLSRVSNQGRDHAMPPPPPGVVDRLGPVYDAVRTRLGDAVPTGWRY